MLPSHGGLENMFSFETGWCFQVPCEGVTLEGWHVYSTVFVINLQQNADFAEKNSYFNQVVVIDMMHDEGSWWFMMMTQPLAQLRGAPISYFDGGCRYFWGFTAKTKTNQTVTDRLKEGGGGMMECWLPDVENASGVLGPPTSLQGRASM